MSNKKQKNVFAELQKNRTRGKGLSSSPNLITGLDNTKLNEHSEAVSPTQRKPRRTYRISTYIFEDSGDALDELILKIKKAEGKKPKISEALERAIEELSNNF